MNRTDADIGRPDDSPDGDVPAIIFCRLFSDQVSEHLCLLRKIELGAKAGFSCEGCAMDALVRKRLKPVREFLGLGGNRNE